ncbi:unnamed protein product [Ectocarpus sp. CCAP 1310/34]|nr:unnamed protein product [Ectocarpus sp. CCAP 1310/34]
MQRLPDKNTRRGREGRGGSDPRVESIGFGREGEGGHCTHASCPWVPPRKACVPRNVQRATSCLRCRGIVSQCNPLSHGIWKELGKLAELKQRGLILDRHFETIKAHVKAGNSVAKERWDAIESAWGLKQNGVFDEEEWVTQIDGETARGAAPPSQHPPAAAGTARRKAVDRGKQARERAAKGTLGGNICNAFVIGSRGPIERTRGGVKELISGISFPPPTPESHPSCPHCPMTFVNEQGLGIHVGTQHSSANMPNGVRLRRMLRKDVGGSVLPSEAAGPGRCWQVNGSAFSISIDLDSDGYMDRKPKDTRGAAKRRRYKFRFTAHPVNQLRILQDNAEDLWMKEEQRTPLQFLEDRLKVPFSNIVKWAKKEKELVAAAADDAEKRLYKGFVERRKRKLKVSTLWLTITFRKLVREMYPGDQRAASFCASFRWARRWAKRHNLYKRRRTNLKNKSVEERLPEIQRFHRLFRKLLQKPVQLLGTWDKRGALRVAISQPFPGLEKRQCTMQDIFGPGEKTMQISVIFRGTGKRISPVEKAAYHEDVDVFFQVNAWANQKFCMEWAKRSYREGLMRGRGVIDNSGGSILCGWSSKRVGHGGAWMGRNVLKTCCKV